ncbi:MAG TPA: CCA tRNA nucleotidyltransferase [Bacillales bacterium]|nr:CCA tRNA nucleotidyltransferase [Bacillales bacterium]
MLEPQFQEAAAILDKLKAGGYEAYIVGGAVRDYLLDKAIQDIDIATSAKPEEVRELFTTTIPVGIQHGTVIVRYKHRSYEVTTFRTESEYEDHRRPSSVSFVSSLNEDLLRRDFTMNAIAMSVDGEIIDPFSGEEDIRKGIIRTVGRAEDRFREDPLRMMRAARFASQLSFRIEEQTGKALKGFVQELRHISIERITTEFEKLLLGRDSSKAFQMLLESGLYAFLPDLADHKRQLWQLTRFDLSRLEQLEERWALLSVLLEIKAPSSWLKQWKLSNKKTNEITRIREAVRLVSEEAWTPLIVYKTGIETALSAERVYTLLHNRDPDLEGIREIAEKLAINRRSELAVGGNDLLKWIERKPGPWVAERIEAIESAVIRGEVENDKEAVRAWLQKQLF